MIKLCPAPTFKVDVELPVPGEERPGLLTLTVRWMSRTDRQAWFAAAVEKRDDAAALHEVIADWHGVVDEAGMDVIYSLQKLRTVIDHYEGVAERVLVAIAEGYREGRVKNL